MVLSSLLTHKRLYLLALSLTLLAVSLFGPPTVKVYGVISTLDISKLIEILTASETIFRMPDTHLRLLIFTSAMLLLIMIPLINVDNEINYKIPDHKILLIIFMFFATYLSTNYLYNILALVLFLISIYYCIFLFNDKLEKYELIFITSYLMIFLYPFYHSLYISSELTEVDNYLRFLLAIPVYLLSRSLIFRDTDILYSINIVSIIIGLSALYYYLFYNDIRVRGFTSTSAIFSNISLLFAVLSFCTIKKLYMIRSRYAYISIIGTMFALIAWSTTGSRGSIIALFFLLVLIMFNKKLRTEYLFFNIKYVIMTTFVFSLIFYQSGSLTRMQNAYQSTYNYIYSDSPHHWKHEDSIVPRMSLWKGSLNMIYDNSALGVGLSNYNNALNDQIISGNIKPIRQDPLNYTAGMNHAHSQYLDIFAKTGMIGFLTLIYFILANYYFFYNNLKINRNNIPGFMGSIVLTSYVSYMIYHTVLSHQQSILFMTFSLAILAGLSYSNANRKRIK